MKGIDISSHNGNIDFNSVKNDGVQIVIIKATEGVDWLDPSLDKYYNGANGVIPYIGFYHFMSERTNPSQQAEDFYNAIKGKNYNLKPCLDIETNNQGRSASQITDRCLEFINRFKELSGQDCIIYSGAYFSRDNLDSRIKNVPLWVAHYGVNTPIGTGFPNMIGHQFTESGRVAGISGNVDVNNFYENGLYYINGISTPIQTQTPVQSPQGDNIVSQLQSLINSQGFGNISVDGIAGNETLGNCPMVREGASGLITQWIQLRVGANPDSDFGPATKRAVQWFQQSRGLLADGIVGQNTWRALLGI